MFKRIFLIVMDSVGIGAMADADKFGDAGTNTWVHVSEKKGGLKVPVMNYLGIGDLGDILGTSKVSHPHSYTMKLNEKSNGKDTLTGHQEMMGKLTLEPLVTFTDTGFPKELIDELEKESGRKIIGNIAASGTQIIYDLGEQSMREGSIIVYTSSDSVLQIAANTAVIPLEELYRICEIARRITMKKEWKVGRIIARPFIGEDKDHFVRTSDRRDYALPVGCTIALNDLQRAGKKVIGVGKIHDIFDGTGIDESIHTTSNEDGMNQTIAIAKRDFTGLCFVNLVDFDSLYGHRRNPLGYGDAIEAFDTQLCNLINCLNKDDLLLITADHGNDPTHTGTDHTREKVPLIAFSTSYNNGKLLNERDTFADIGRTILENYGITPSPNEIGSVISELIND